MPQPSRATRSARMTSGAGDNRRERVYLVLSLECERPLVGSLCLPLDAVDSVVIGRGLERAIRREAAGRGERVTLTVPDEWMSQTHARLRSSFGRWIVEDTGSKNGVRINGHELACHTLKDRDIIELGHTFLVYRDRAADGLERPAGDRAAPAPGMATFDAELAGQLDDLVHLAPTTIPVLLSGESGTGKELMARGVHQLSGRTGEFVAVNCGALPESLVESELFGHREGAFSGATAPRPGLIRAADRGTLFLDEIGDLRPSSQAALLRVLQDSEVRPVGGVKSVAVDIRLVSATHRDLAGAVERGDFRHDLYARIAGFRMHLPPIRERLEDRGLLVATLLGHITASGAGRPSERDGSVDRASSGVALAPEAARAVFFYDWPLNVRELSNCLRTAVVLARGKAIELAHLPPEVRAAAGGARSDAAAGPPPLSDDQRQLRDELKALLAENNGNITHVARAMGKSRRQIQRWLKRFDLDPVRHRE